MPDRIEVHGAGKGGVDYIEVPTPNEAVIAALFEERRGYEYDLAAGAEFRHGMPIAATIEAIDAQIAYYGGAPPLPTAAPEAPTETEPGCTHPACVLVHPHAGPAILDVNAAARAGLILDKATGLYKRRVGPRERKTS